MASRSRLGKGLGALFPALPGEGPTKQAKTSDDATVQQDNKTDTLSSRPGTREQVAAQSAKTEAKPSSGAQSKSKKGGAATAGSDSKTAAKVKAGVRTTTRTSATARGNADGVPNDGAKADTTATQSTAGTKESSKNATKKNATAGSATSTSAKATAGRGSKPGKVSRETSVSTKGRNTPRMPNLDSLKHPSDLFFGPTVTNVSRETYREATSSAENKTRSGSQKNLPDVSSASAEKKTAEPVEAPQGDAADGNELKPVQGGYLVELQTDEIRPNAQQPRHIFDEDELLELSRSIKEVGVLQPIVVRKTAKTVAQPTQEKPVAGKGGGSGDRLAAYEIIMGERRWRATQLAGLTSIPAIVKTTSDDTMLRDALLENLHRVALNPLEEAAAYQQMIDEFGLTQDGLSKSVSKSRPQITNTLRLLKLPPSVQKKVSSGVLSAGHARALLTLPTEEDMNAVANKIIAEGLSVRSTEELVALKTGQTKPKSRKSRPDIWTDSPVRQNLESRFDTKVAIKGTKKHGRIEIVFSSPEDMDRILAMLLNGKQDGSNPPDQTDGWV